MVVEDTPPPPPPPSHTDKIILFSIPNKDARALNLDNELRSIKIGKMTVNEYCTKIKSMTDRLKNLGCVVSDKNLVIYTVNGLDSRSGDLYPVTKPSTLPTDFVSTSSTTWHQCLGHPGDEVLRSLSSRQFIYCNKAKSAHVCHACQLDPNWCNAVYDEYNALVKNDTWILVPRPTDANLVRSMWLFKHKFHVDGTLSRYKARLVANGSSQQLRVDFDETFSSVVKPATIRTVLSLAPTGFVDSRYPNHVCLLQRSLYGLKQAHRAWFQRFAGYATRAGFSPSRCDSSLFIYTQGSQVAYLLIYVDDIILTASSPVILQQIVDSLRKEFDMTDLGALNYFLGISAVRHPTGLFLSQKREPHFAALKRILRYVQGTLELGLRLYASATTSLVGYTDADWAGCPSTRRYTFGYCVFLGDNLLSWYAKRQHTISRSSAEAKYQGVANVVAETARIRNLLRELHSSLLTATLVYCDNVSAVYMSANPVQHQRTKHIEIDIHFVRDMVKACRVRVLHVSFRFKYADIFTKCIPSALFEDFQSSLSVRPSPAQTTGAY
nr:ribonuclease H-like domain-containing protein [Tanacetum cinerariifolium]